MMNKNTVLPENFTIGHYNDDYTGVTVILCGATGAIGGVDVRGGAPGTHETDCLRNEKMMDKINGVALCGGSAYGLGAIAGVMEYLKNKRIGFPVGDKVVPIVPGAVIFDINDKEYRYPTSEFGYKAAENATATPLSGKIGVGKGATVGKIRGIKHSMPSGIGISSLNIGDATVTAVVCVNALGDVIDEKTGNILAGAKDDSGNYIHTVDFIFKNAASPTMGSNTTIGCILTDAAITKVQANKLASISHNGLARTISPVHTDFDGDTMFCLSSGRRKADFLALEIAAQEATALAVNDAVTSF